MAVRARVAIESEWWSPTLQVCPRPPTPTARTGANRCEAQVNGAITPIVLDSGNEVNVVSASFAADRGLDETDGNGCRWRDDLGAL
jgi:hypothetical protein